ncbi:MAG: bifunctional class I SAM-dependent methyltransferase/glycosyltransferase family 2 protein [Nitrospira sp. BO4]|jgi:SAM-dependent methyltransferase|nr:bifunctional class I SAM-dependent methyltransferase/glycosyltransferase family 2 protein [Nitrospira sp. BO4]
MEPARLHRLFDSVELTSDEAHNPFQTRGKSQTDAKKQAIRDHFDACAGLREYWEKKARTYYEDQIRYFSFLVPEGLSVLEIGSGLGNLLAALKPRRGVGIDLSAEMVKEAAHRHPALEFRVGDAETIEIEETFDVIILADVVGHLLDVEAALRRLRRACAAHTRIVVSYYSHLWEPILRFCETVGMKMPQREQNWLSPEDIANLLHLADFDVVKVERRLLLPKRVPLLSSLCNKLLAYLPGLRALCLCHYVVARPRLRRPERPYSTTIVVPCRNERGNIDAALRRIPRFGGRQEIIFVDGHSTDGTPDEIRRVMAFYPGKDIKLIVQNGKGKGDAVREGFAHARGDVLMILDADLTMPPEALPKFYEAIASGKGEFINGCRLVYPMEAQAMRLLNLIGNKLFGLAFSWLLNQKIKDTLCGTKVLFRRDYERLAANRHYFGEFDPFGDFDLLFGASKLNLHILEIPIRYEARTYGSTNIQRFRHGWLLLKMTVYGFFRLKAV